LRGVLFEVHSKHTTGRMNRQRFVASVRAESGFGGFRTIILGEKAVFSFYGDRHFLMFSPEEYLRYSSLLFKIF
jgi:hypothetical protein